ncbi:MAG TPA: hypothetical protein VH988_18725 [Thermoanaerobaculia bacterium]|jgi:hypothetical protein|nr:hypothetical protein [Thermoanaerobaculia bacterium]
MRQLARQERPQLADECAAGQGLVHRRHRMQPERPRRADQHRPLHLAGVESGLQRLEQPRLLLRLVENRRSDPRRPVLGRHRPQRLALVDVVELEVLEMREDLPREARLADLVRAGQQDQAGTRQGLQPVGQETEALHDRLAADNAITETRRETGAVCGVAREILSIRAQKCRKYSIDRRENGDVRRCDPPATRPKNRRKPRISR